MLVVGSSVAAGMMVCGELKNLSRIDASRCKIFQLQYFPGYGSKVIRFSRLLTSTKI
jgi:hypothetical protein